MDHGTLSKLQFSLFNFHVLEDLHSCCMWLWRTLERELLVIFFIRDVTHKYRRWERDEDDVTSRSGSYEPRPLGNNWPRKSHLFVLPVTNRLMGCGESSLALLFHYHLDSSLYRRGCFRSSALGQHEWHPISSASQLRSFSYLSAFASQRKLAHCEILNVLGMWIDSLWVQQETRDIRLEITWTVLEYIGCLDVACCHKIVDLWYF